MNIIRAVPLSKRLAIGFMLFVLIVAVLGVWSYRTGAEIAINGPVFKRLILGKELYADVGGPAMYIVESQLACLDLSVSTDEAEQDAVIARLSKLKNNYRQVHAYWKSQSLDPRIAELLLIQANSPAEAFYRIAYYDLIPAVRRGNKRAIQSSLKALKVRFDQHKAVMDQVILNSTEVERDAVSWSEQRVHDIGLGIAAALVAALSLLLLLGWLLRNSITQPLTVALAIANKVSRGQFDVEASTPYADEPGRLVSALGVMSANLQSSLSALQHANYVNDQAMQVTRSGSWSIDFQKSPDTIVLSERARDMLGEHPVERGEYPASLLYSHRIGSGERVVNQAVLDE